MTVLIDWLLEGPPWVEYGTRLDLLHQAGDAPAVRSARGCVAAHGSIRGIIEVLSKWPGPPLKSHKSAGHPLHLLSFLADVGLGVGDPGVEPILSRVLAHQAPEGPFQVLANINPRYGGTGEDQWVWMLCDAPLVLCSLVKLGFRDDPRVRGAVEYLVSLGRENGWPCGVCPDLGKFRGPGRRADPCPYATLLTLKLLAQLPEMHSSSAAHAGAESLLTLWEQRRERRPYLFAMGSGFEKLKAPLIWYDILHVTDVLSRFGWLREDSRLRQMASSVASKADEEGRFIAESVWLHWKGWDFGQKREPSRWLTLVAQRMLARVGLEHPELGGGSQQPG